MSPTEALRRTIGHEGVESMPLAPGGDTGEGAIQNQLDKGGYDVADGVLGGVPCRDMHLSDDGADYQERYQGLQRNLASGGPVEGHHQYH